MEFEDEPFEDVPYEGPPDPPRTGNPELHKTVMSNVAEKLGLSSLSDVMRVINEIMKQVRTTSDPRVVELANDIADDVNRAEALRSQWVFGNRYAAHKFVTNNPTCHNCKNEVPHRTMLLCPTCGAPGPWSFLEHRNPSSHIHYLMAWKVQALFDNTLMTNTGDARADMLVSAIPRGGAKSTWLFELASLWVLLTGRVRCELLLSNTTPQVAERVMEVRGELESNDLIIQDFGEQAASRQDPRKWAQDDFIMANGARLVGRAAGSSMRGVKNKQYRPDYVNADDADDDKFITTSEQAVKIDTWWDQRVVPSCSPNAIVDLHGTMLTDRSLIHKLMYGHRGQSGHKTIVQAINDYPGCSVCGMPGDVEGKHFCHVCRKPTPFVRPCSYWGARFTMHALESIRSRVGHWAFEAEYQQKSRNDKASWFREPKVESNCRTDLRAPSRDEIRVIPWEIMKVTLSGEEAYEKACLVSPVFIKRGPNDLGPYQAVHQAWDPAWAREKSAAKGAARAFMACVSVGLTLDDKLDIFFCDRRKSLPGTKEYRTWMYETWKRAGEPVGYHPALYHSLQVGMPVESNGAGVLFQMEIEEHWNSIPIVRHQTGDNKWDLEDGIPGLGSWNEDGRLTLRMGDPTTQEAMEELKKEIKQSGGGEFKDMLMALWIGWYNCAAFMKTRDKARYDELCRRDAHSRSTTNKR